MRKLLLLPLLFLSFAHAETFQCKVVGVIDGDTITCLTEQKEQIKVKLYQIDAPEAGQAYWKESKKQLIDVIDNSQILIIKNEGANNQEQTLGTFYLKIEAPCFTTAGIETRSNCYVYFNINEYMVRKGFAWYYPFDGDNLEYQQAEKKAREAKRGLWVNKHAMPPWEYRKQIKGKKK